MMRHLKMSVRVCINGLRKECRSLSLSLDYSVTTLRTMAVNDGSTFCSFTIAQWEDVLTRCPSLFIIYDPNRKRI